MPRSYPARAALDVTNTIFGGSFGSMLMQALRVKTGLTYAASSTFRRGSVAGEFSIGSFTTTASTRRALSIALSTLDRLHRTAVTAGAIDSARTYILGQYPLGLETAADWAAALANLELYGLPDSYIDEYAPALARVDRALARAVIAEAFPRSADLDIVLIGDGARIRGAASGLGALTEKPLSDPDFGPAV